MKNDLDFWYFILGLISIMVYILCGIVYIEHADKLLPILIIGLYSFLRSKLEAIDKKIDKLNK